MNWEVKTMTSENLSSNVQTEEIIKQAKSSNGGLSAMWMTTLMRRNIIVAFVAFLAYFGVAILPLIINFSHFDFVSDYYKELLSGGSAFIPFITVIYVISLSVLMFDYLHNNASTAALHSFPVTRGKLFRTTIITGLMLIVIPIVLTAVLMSIAGLIMPPVTGQNGITDPGEILEVTACFKWVLDTLLGAFFVFSIANLAGIVAGKNIIHALLAYLLNAIVPIIFILIDSYADAFIFGSTGSSLGDFAPYTNPFTWYMIVRDGSLSAKDIPVMLIFLCIAVLITILAGILYKAIKLEREQNATVFPVVSDLLVIFLSFCGMSVFGLTFSAIELSSETTLPLRPFLLGSAIGGVISFIVFRMIADSSVRIMKPRTFVNFACFLMVTAVVFAFTCFDITGQANRVPSAGDVSRIELAAFAPFDPQVKLELSDKESIDDIIALHKEIIKNKETARKRVDVEHNTYTTVAMKYRLKNGMTLSRSYEIPLARIPGAQDKIEKLAESDEYIMKVKQHMLKAGRIKTSQVSLFTSISEIDIKRDDLRRLLLAYMNDYENNGFGYYYNLQNSVGNDPSGDFTEYRFGTINVYFEWSEEIDDSFTDISLTFGKKDKNVYSFLKENGYVSEIVKAEKRDKNNNEAA